MERNLTPSKAIPSSNKLAALIELSKYRLPTIATTIVTVIENVSKSPLSRNDDIVPKDVLQSQLFLLRMLSACMHHHWKYCQDLDKKAHKKQRQDGTESPMRPSLNRVDGTTPQHSMWSPPEGMPPVPIDPPPLEDNLAKHIVHVMSRFIYQIGILDEKEHGIVANHSASACSTETYTNFNGQTLPTSLMVDIYRAASRVVAYVSASNWPITFAKIKNRILYLTTTQEENPEVTDVMLLECASLNCKRLSMVLTELCSSALHLRKAAQLFIAVMLRRAIWNWIENYTAEFTLLCHNQTRIDGSPEILFDIFNSLADTTKRKAIFWPVQTMLLVLCPDIMISQSLSGGRVQNKKSAFFGSLRKAMKGDRMGELAAICYVDLCRAATYVSKDDMTAIRQVVPDVENELIDKLFDIHRPADVDSLSTSLGVYIDHRSLMADCIVAMFRLDTQKTIHSLIPTCFDHGAPTIFKLSVVKAAVAIASEENNLPWIPSISELYIPLCTRIRKLFLEFFSRDFREKSDASSVSSRKTLTNNLVDKRSNRKDGRTAAQERFELILDVLRLYQTDPKLAIQGQVEGRFDQNAALMVAITNCLRDQSVCVRDAAAECLYKLHTPDNIILWGLPDRFMESFWKISSQVLFTLAKQLLDSRERENGLRKLLDLLKRLLTLRNTFLEQHRDVATFGIDTRERLQASIGLEVALLVLLCSYDTDICTLSIDCFGLLCTEVHLTERLDDPQPSSITIVENMACYTELTNHSGVVTGRKSQQRRIRRLLRMINHSSPGMLAAWEEAWKRWKFMTPLIARTPDDTKDDSSFYESSRKAGGSTWHDKLRNTSSRQLITPTSSSTRLDMIDDDRSSEWQNYAGFLAALGGVCLMTEASSSTTSITSSSVPPSPSSSVRSRPTDSPNYNKHISAPIESATMVDKFIMDMVDLLACDNLIVREWVREILGNDLSPALYHIMFRHLENTLMKCFGPDNNDPICGPRYTLFVEQAISVLKQVLDRLSEKTDNLFTVDFSTLINQCALYLNKLGTNQLSIKIKIKMCQLVEVLMSKKDSVTLRQEFRLRNKLLEIIVEWTSDFSLKPDNASQSSNYEVNQVEKLQSDLDIACLKTIVALLHHLPLQPSEPVVESDALVIKSRIFYKYFTYFFKLLNRCRVSEIENSQTRSYDSQFRTGSELAPLKNYTILALSNLLSANVDAGLKYSFSMGYHEDTRTRSAFMEVLTNILNQGTEFETLAETVMTDRYEKLIDMLVQNDLRIVLSLCEVCPSSDIDDVANALLACFASRNKTMTLLKAVIEREVETTENETDLFRKTSIATRLLSVYAKNNGADYVRSVLLPVFQKLSERPREDKCFELDPSKIGPDEDINKNRNNVIEATEMFLNAICDSVNDAPLSFREICHYILTSVREQFPEAKYTAVGSFIFLRFFCPAIVSPETEGLIKNTASISREMRRGFLIATKVIQNLANNVLFGAKETYMIVLNDFLTSNIYKVASFLREISKVSAVEPAAATTTTTTSEDVVEVPQMDEKLYAMLHRVLADNIERISRDGASRRLGDNQDQDSVSAWKREFDKFANLLAQLGRPPEVPQKESVGTRSYVYAASNQLYADFMRRNSHRSVEVIVSKNIFYEGGVSKAGRPVFYLIMRHINADNIDFELLIYHVLQTLERASNRHYELLIDLTRFCRLNEIPGQWVHQLMQILSEDKSDNIAICHIYNPNTYLRTFIKKLARPLSHKFTKRILFAVTLAELHEHILPSEVRLPKSTTGLETDPSAVFFPVNKILKYTTHLPVTVKVSAEYVQIMTVRKQEIFYGLNAITNDVCHISEIEDIATSHHERSSLDSTQDFSYKCTRENIVLTFNSPKKEAIINTIRHSKRRYEMSRPTNISERTIQPNDVPGRLLNMALLNLGSDDPNLRLSSYNLLYALSRVFNFDVGKQLLDAKDLCLPANSTEFIVNISEKIAATEPSLTLEFLNECVLGYGKSEQGLRYLCLLYMIPWLPNLSLFCNRSPQDTAKIKELLRLLIDLTLTGEMSKLIQAKVWKTIAKVDDILNLVIDTFILVSNEHGVGSMQAEALADTLVTLSNVTVRSKLTSYLRKIIHRTSFKPTRSLTDHPSWPEIAILVRFILMLSFNNRGPVKRVVPELFHIVSLIAGVGCTVVRASVHGVVVNMIQSLCTSMPLSAANIKKLQLLLIELSESKSRLLFGLNRSNANAFTITPETLNDTIEPISLLSLESIVSKLSEVINYAAPTTDIANFWRARWMSLVASTAFQFNPAVQPRAFIVLGYLGREEIDDDLLYQILVALRGALAIFNDSDPHLVTSIMMCLKNVVESLPGDSRYLLQLFWVAVALVEINTGPTFAMAVELLQAVVRALDSSGFFSGDTMIDVLLAAREPIADVARQLDNLCGVNFDSHFSFAIAGIFMKGLRYNDVKDAIYHGLHTFLDIERKQFLHDGLSEESSIIETSTLGYVTGLLPLAAKNDTVKDLLKMAGLTETDIDSHVLNGRTYAGIFDKLDIPDNTTALLLISLLANMLNAADNESERLFIYGLLSEAAIAIPEVFSLVYDSLLPKMNQIVISSQTQPIIESVKSILLTACSDPVFSESKNKPSQRVLLDQLGFSSLGDPTFGASCSNIFQNAKLASELMERIIS
ncbi:Ras GTPase activating protein ira2 [Mucor circinelloides]